MERPTGVTILALLGFLSAALLAGTALVMFVSATFLANLAARPGFDMLAGSGGAIFGVAFLVFAAFYLVGAIGVAVLVWILLYLLKPRVKQAFGATGS